MGGERERLIESKQRNVLRNDVVTWHGSDDEQERKVGDATKSRPAHPSSSSMHENR